jgi:hypothetical protein
VSRPGRPCRYRTGAADPRSPRERIYPPGCLIAIAVCAFTAAGNGQFTSVGAIAVDGKTSRGALVPTASGSTPLRRRRARRTPAGPPQGPTPSTTRPAVSPSSCTHGPGRRKKTRAAEQATAQVVPRMARYGGRGATRRLSLFLHAAIRKPPVRRRRHPFLDPGG